MKVEKIISNAMKKIDLFIENEVEEIDFLKKYEMTDPDLSNELSRMLIEEINRDE